MIEIKDLLSKFEKLLAKSSFDKELILSTIEKKTKVKIDKKEIKVINNILYITTKPIKKNEIFIKKQEILKELKEVNQTSNIFDIR